MKILLLTDRAGVSFCEYAGDVIDVSPEEGNALIRAGQAEAVNTSKEIETEAAVLVAPENAAKNFTHNRKRR